MTHPAITALQPVPAPTGEQVDAINAVCECARVMDAAILKRADDGHARSTALGCVAAAYRAAVDAILRPGC